MTAQKKRDSEGQKDQDSKDLNVPEELGNEPVLRCGLVMPISPIDGCGVDHWVEVKSIITDSIKSIGDPEFQVLLVSDQNDVGVIQKRIVNNLYSCDVVVCDVSCKNPNVMFELGMRLAFDKPTVIVKDDVTDYSFDTGVIEHLTYPRDLRFSKMVKFKDDLAAKVLATHKAALSDPDHSTFLKSFGSFSVASLKQASGTPDQVIIEMLQDLNQQVSHLKGSYSGISNAILYGGKSIMRDALVNELELKALVKDTAKKFALTKGIQDYSALVGSPSFHDYLMKNIPRSAVLSSNQDFYKLVEGVLQDL